MQVIDEFFITIHATQFIEMSVSAIEKQRKPNFFSTIATSNLIRICLILKIIIFNVITNSCLLNAETCAIEYI